MSIKIIEAPSVYLVGHQQVNVTALDAFLADIGAPDWTTDAISPGEKLIETAGRVCYESFKKPRPGGNKAYIEHIIDVGHGSVLEHEVFNLIITGVSRSLTHQLERHRAGWSYSELSQRYVDASDFAFVVPPEYIGDPLSLAVWSSSCGTALNHYEALMRGSGNRPAASTIVRKRARESARSVLPECIETKIFVTANARALRHFLELRGSYHADAEIRRLSLVLLAVLVIASPHVFGDYAVVPVDGIDTIQTIHRKV